MYKVSRGRKAEQLADTMARMRSKRTKRNDAQLPISSAQRGGERRDSKDRKKENDKPKSKPGNQQINCDIISDADLEGLYYSPVKGQRLVEYEQNWSTQQVSNTVKHQVLSKEKAIEAAVKLARDTLTDHWLPARMYKAATIAQAMIRQKKAKRELRAALCRSKACAAEAMRLTAEALRRSQERKDIARERRTGAQIPPNERKRSNLIFNELYNLQTKRKNSQFGTDKHRPSNLIPKHTSRFAMVSVENWTKFVTEWHTSSRDQWMGSQSKQKQEQWWQQPKESETDNSSELNGTSRETLLIFAHILLANNKDPLMDRLRPRRLKLFGLIHRNLKADATGGHPAITGLLRALPTMLPSHKPMTQMGDSGVPTEVKVRRHQELNMEHLRPMVLHTFALPLVQQWRQRARVAKMIQWIKKCEEKREKNEAKWELKQLNQSKKKRSKNTHSKTLLGHRLLPPAITDEKAGVTVSTSISLSNKGAGEPTATAHGEDPEPLSSHLDLPTFAGGIDSEQKDVDMGIDSDGGEVPHSLLHTVREVIQVAAKVTVQHIIVHSPRRMWFMSNMVL